MCSENLLIFTILDIQIKLNLLQIADFFQDIWSNPR